MKKTVWNEGKIDALERMAREGSNPYQIAKAVGVCHETVRKKMRDMGLVGLVKKQQCEVIKRNIKFEDVCKIYRQKYKVDGKFKYNGKLHKIKQVCQWQLILDGCVTVSFADMYVSDCLRMG